MVCKSCVLQAKRPLQTHHNGMRRFINPLLLLVTHSHHADLIRQIQYLKAENEVLRSKLPRVIRISVLNELGDLMHNEHLVDFRRYATSTLRPLHAKAVDATSMA